MANCKDCHFWNSCRGMMQVGTDCFYPSAKYAIENTISAMLEKFGEDSQIDVAVEEMSELIKELIKYKRSKLHFREKQAASREHVVEEIGDVMFMMEYLKRIFNISDEEVKKIVREKAERTKRRYIDGEE